MHCKVIFVLNDGTELLGKEIIEENLYLFPPNILDVIKPIFIKTSNEIIGWNKSIIRVYQNGKYKIEPNIE